MIGAVIILLITVFVGLLLYVYDLKWRRKQERAGGTGREKTSGKGQGEPEIQNPEPEARNPESHGDLCCGRHLVCEKSLSPMPGDEIVYYEDEELDRFADRSDKDYTPEEIEEFREVMTTMLPSDLPGWVRSLQLRRISLPLPLRDELFLLLDCP